MPSTLDTFDTLSSNSLYACNTDAYPSMRLYSNQPYSNSVILYSEYSFTFFCWPQVALMAESLELLLLDLKTPTSFVVHP